MVSVIIPCYNSEEYIKRCLESVINQNYKDFEAIVINDGSTDSTKEIISNYLSDERIKFYDNENQGIGKTRNFGIEKANGDYITFLDADDFFEEDALDKMMSFALKNDLDLVVCDYCVMRKKVEYKENGSFDITNVKENPIILLNIDFAPWAKLYKSDLIRNIRFEEDLKYEDLPFSIKSILSASKIGKLNSSVLYYTVHENSETNKFDEKVFDIIKVVNIVRKELEEKGYNDIAKQLVVKVLTNHTIRQRYNSDKKIREEFIDEVFSYFERYVPDFKSNDYYEGRALLKRTIEKNKFLTKLYVNVYSAFL